MKQLHLLLFNIMVSQPRELPISIFTFFFFASACYLNGDLILYFHTPQKAYGNLGRWKIWHEALMSWRKKLLPLGKSALNFFFIFRLRWKNKFPNKTKYYTKSRTPLNKHRTRIIVHVRTIRVSFTCFIGYLLDLIFEQLFEWMLRNVLHYV